MQRFFKTMFLYLLSLHSLWKLEVVGGGLQPIQEQLFLVCSITVQFLE